MIDEYYNMDPRKIEANLINLIQGHDDTYTFTKSCAENYIAKYRGDIPLVILRPSIIISTSRDPFPGWTDTASAAGVVGLPVLIGINRVFYLGKGVIDFIPGDIVSNSIIVAGAYAAWTPKPQLTITHCTSSI